MAVPIFMKQHTNTVVSTILTDSKSPLDYHLHPPRENKFKLHYLIIGNTELVLSTIFEEINNYMYTIFFQEPRHLSEVRLFLIFVKNEAQMFFKLFLIISRLSVCSYLKIAEPQSSYFSGNPRLSCS